MTIATQPPWFAEFRDRICGHLRTVVDGIQAAGAIYVEALTRDPSFKDWIQDEFPDVPGTTWRNLERVGLGQLDARIASGSPAYGNRLRRYPISEQRRALDGTIPLLTAGGDTLHVRIEALMPHQADQVFHRDHIRDLAEQRAWMEDRAARLAPEPVARADAVEIDRKRGRIVVNGYPITAAELADYLSKVCQ
jgi:hypothetical protein